MVSSILSRVFLLCAIANGTVCITPAQAETSRLQRIGASIANSLTTTIPLRQCQYPRFWSHGDSVRRDISLLEDRANGQTTAFYTYVGESSTPLRKAPSVANAPEGHTTSPLLPSAQTAALFERITHYFVQLGYKVPPTLTVIESRSPNAFIRKGHEVVLTTGMAKQVTEPSELAFVLAHEVAHVALGHHLQGGVSAEVAADSLALKVMTALGFNPCSGTSVLERLGSPSQITLVSVTPRLHALHNQTSSLCS